MPRAASPGSTRSTWSRRGHPEPPLEPEHLLARRPALDPVGAVRRGREVRVGHGDDPARHRLHERVEPLPAGGPQDREPRDHLRARARVPAEQPRQRPGVALGLLQPDHVGAAGPDDAGQLAQRLRAPVRDRAPAAGGQVVVVAAVEDVEAHHRQAHLGRRSRGGRGRRCGRHRRRRRDEDEPEGHGEAEGRAEQSVGQPRGRRGGGRSTTSTWPSTAATCPRSCRDPSGARCPLSVTHRAVPLREAPAPPCLRLSLPSPSSARPRRSSGRARRRPGRGRRRASKRAVELPGLAQVVGRRPDAGAEPGEERRPEGGGLDEPRPLDRDARPGRPGAGRAGRWPTAPPSTRSGAPRPGMVSSTSRTSKAIASSVARTMCARVVPRVMPMIRPRACGSQCGAPSPVSAGHEDHALGVVDGRGDRRGLGGRADDLQAVAQPLHGRAGHEDRALERVGQLAVGGAPGRGRQQPGVGALERGAGVGEDERAGAVGALRVARVEAGLPEQRRLLVAGDPGDRQRQVRGTTPGRCVAISPQLGTSSGSASRGYAEQRAQLVGPVAGRRGRTAACGRRWRRR